MSPGVHILIDIFGVPFKLLDDERFIQDSLRKIATSAGVKIIHLYSHKFTPQGVTCIAIISESHFSIHTWPEYSFAAIDLFTCGTGLNLSKVVQDVLTSFKGDYHQIRTFLRGNEDDRSLGIPSDIRFS